MLDFITVLHILLLEKIPAKVRLNKFNTKSKLNYSNYFTSINSHYPFNFLTGTHDKEQIEDNASLLNLCQVILRSDSLVCR